MITIITPSYNRAGMITEAIESVLAQDSVAFEHIVVDGGSTDGTLGILEQYSHLRVILGPDRGIYDALNKGLDAATGEIIGFLNTDDMYSHQILAKVATKFDDPEIMAVAGRAVVISQLPQGSPHIVEHYAPDDRSLMERLTTGGAFFNAWFFRKSTFDLIGKFDPVYKVAGDQDFMFRFAFSNLKYTTLNELVYNYRMHQDSLTFDKKGDKRVWSADEQLAIINPYLRKEDLPKSTKKLLIHVQTLETVDMAARSIWMLNFRKFIYYSLEGFKYEPFWLMKFIPYVLKRGIVLLQATWSAKSLASLL